jgi:predicted RNA-binding protein with PUA-like domain
MQYWLLKSEPTAYSIDDLKREGTTAWEGVRNYQARNFMKQMRLDDQVLFYHSNTESIGVVGVAKVVAEAHPDESQFNIKDAHYDRKAIREKPIWHCIDVAFVEKFRNPILLGVIKADPALRGILLAKPGSRLSVQPVSKQHFDYLCKEVTAAL